DLELAGGLQVGAAGARLRENLALFVGQETDRLGAPGIDAEHVHHMYGTSPGMFDRAREVLRRGVADRAFPAATVEVGDDTQVLWREPFGRLTFDDGAAETREDTIF